jgi:hypothetical protein
LDWGRKTKFINREEIKKETKPKDFIRIAGKKNERITNFFTIKI